MQSSGWTGASREWPDTYGHVIGTKDSKEKQIVTSLAFLGSR
jgi:hypothetical protein